LTFAAVWVNGPAVTQTPQERPAGPTLARLTGNPPDFGGNKKVQLRPAKPKETVPPRHEPLVRQLLRARQAGRGREATSPLRIPWKGWKDIFLRTAAQVSEHRLTAISAGVVFFGLLGLFSSHNGVGVGLRPFRAASDHPRSSRLCGRGDQIARVVAKSDAKLGWIRVWVWIIRWVRGVSLVLGP
jgi:hypothetical protein